MPIQKTGRAVWLKIAGAFALGVLLGVAGSLAAGAADSVTPVSYAGEHIVGSNSEPSAAPATALTLTSRETMSRAKQPSDSVGQDVFAKGNSRAPTSAAKGQDASASNKLPLLPIAGKVVDAYGRPLAGVLVRAEPPMRVVPMVSGFGRGFISAERRAQVYLQQARARDSETLQGVTGADGDYSIPVSLNGPHVLTAYLRGYSLESTSPASAGAQPGGQVDFVASQLVELTVQVRLPEGGQAESSEIEVQQKDGMNRDAYVWHASDPAIFLAPGRWKLRAVDHGEPSAVARRELASPWTDVDAGLQSDPLQIDLQLADRPSVFGVVMSKDRHWLGECNIYLVEAEKAASVALDTVAHLGTLSESGSDGSSGYVEFTFLDVRPGKYVVAAQLSEMGQVLTSDPVEVVDRTVRCDLSVPALEVNSGWTVRAYGPKNLLLNDCSFSLVVETESGDEDVPSTGVRAGPGSYTVVPGKGFVASAAPLRLMAYSAKLGVQSIYLPKPPQSVEVRFTEGSIVHVRLAGLADDDSCRAFSLNVFSLTRGRPFASSPAFSTSFSGNSADADVGPLRADEQYAFVLYRTIVLNDNSDQIPWARQDLRVSQGECKLEFIVPKKHSLKIRFDGDPKPSWANVHMLQYIGEDLPSFSTWLRREHELEYLFPTIPAGTYSFSYWTSLGSGEKRRNCVIPQDSEIVIHERAPDAFMLNADSGEDLARCSRLQPSDVVIAVDGVDLDRADQIWAILQLLRGKRSTTWRVLRNGGVESITFDPTECGVDAILGGIRLVNRLER